MALKKQIEEATIRGLKAHEELLVSTLRMLLATIRNREIEKRGKLNKQGSDAPQELSDEEVLDTVRYEAKKRRDAIAEFTKAGRAALAEKEAKELLILESYLPKELPESEIKEIVREAVEQMGEVTEKDFGKVMAEAMKRLRGLASGEKVSAAVKKALAR